MVVAFERLLRQHRPGFLHGDVEVAVLGGDRNEPELAILANAERVVFYGLEDTADRFVDLDLLPTGEADQRYDLVLMSQVLEHLLYPASALAHVARLLRPGGVAWIACPSSNFRHGSPSYFSAGYSPEAISGWATASGLLELASGTWGSEREAEARMVHHLWLDDFIYRPTKHLRSFLRRKNRQEIGRVLRTGVAIFMRSPRPSLEHAMESYGLYEKP